MLQHHISGTFQERSSQRPQEFIITVNLCCLWWSPLGCTSSLMDKTLLKCFSSVSFMSAAFMKTPIRPQASKKNTLESLLMTFTATWLQKTLISCSDSLYIVKIVFLFLHISLKAAGRFPWQLLLRLRRCPSALIWNLFLKRWNRGNTDANEWIFSKGDLLHDGSWCVSLDTLIHGHETEPPPRQRKPAQSSKDWPTDV